MSHVRTRRNLYSLKLSLVRKRILEPIINLRLGSSSIIITPESNCIRSGTTVRVCRLSGCDLFFRAFRLLQLHFPTRLEVTWLCGSYTVFFMLPKDTVPKQLTDAVPFNWHRFTTEGVS